MLTVCLGGSIALSYDAACGVRVEPLPSFVRVIDPVRLFIQLEAVEASCKGSRFTLFISCPSGAGSPLSPRLSAFLFHSEYTSSPCLSACKTCTLVTKDRPGELSFSLTSRRICVGSIKGHSNEKQLRRVETPIRSLGLTRTLCCFHCSLELKSVC